MSTTTRFYGHLLLRRAPAMLVLLLGACIGGLLLATGLPATYTSQARLLVQGQTISEDLAASTVRMDGLEEVQLLREQVLTRSNMIEIATRLNVFEDINQMTPDQVYVQMALATTISAEGGGNRRNGPSPVLLTMSFQTRSGQIAADVVNEYVTRILAASVRLRTGQAGETLTFFEQEVARLGDELEIRSTRITEFQSENADALPDDQEFRLQRQSMLQERLAAAERERRALVQARARTIEVYEAGAAPVGTVLPPDQQELRQLENELANTLLTFSDSAPQVQALRRRITLLEDRIAQQAGVQGGDATEAVPGTVTDPLLSLRLAEIDTQVETLDVTLGETAAELEQLNAAIARGPLNSIQLQRLERDYENVQLQFENARRALAQASVGERLEVGGRGQRITLLEPPVVPSSPSSPNRRMIALAGGGIGLGLAAALFVLLELLNRSIRRPTELVKALGVTPFATLPYIETVRSRLWRRSLQLTTAFVVLIGVPAALWAVNEYYMPLDQLSEHLLSRLGLT